MRKEENEEIQKEVEMALLALSCIDEFEFYGQELHLNEIKEIIKYHQEHRNLTHLSYLSAWRLLVNRLWVDNCLEEVIVNELHFGREAAGEIEDLSKCVDWRRKEENEKRRKESKEELLLKKWLDEVGICASECKLWNEGFAGLIGIIAQVHRAAKDNHREISEKCIFIIVLSVEKRAVKLDDLLKRGAVNAILEEI
eukprot:MONOS_11447.1-p1 / transcript=MONOS_11447.1 / gene=MONOS_11447 / organism=Monocercomonoides_exilis_PA203 / gene_product=unspecified product / transcript_product=unspecified product / location=Mono_scaffold00575:14635-15298(+) / protein_length=197 / sequence_SO=supercontig / SO=protein_coding / is_pseudo=false